MYAFILRQVIERGGQQFDFGRSTRDAPTYKFKKQWGTEELQCYWHYSNSEHATNLSNDNPKFALAIRAWQHLPIPITKLLGPRLVRNLP